MNTRSHSYAPRSLHSRKLVVHRDSKPLSQLLLYGARTQKFCSSSHKSSKPIMRIKQLIWASRPVFDDVTCGSHYVTTPDVERTSFLLSGSVQLPALRKPQHFAN